MSSPLFTECMRLLRQHEFSKLHQLNPEQVDSQLADTEKTTLAKECHLVGVTLPYRAATVGDAIWALQLSTYLAPEEPTYWRALARAWHVSGRTSGEPLDFQHALKCYERLQSLKGMASEDWSELGRILQVMGRSTGDRLWVERSLHAFRSALEKAESPEPELGRAWLGLAHSALLLFELSGVVSSLQEALDAYHEAVQHDPLNPQVWVESAQLHWIAGAALRERRLRDLALQQIQRAVEIAPDHIRARCWAVQLHGTYGVERDDLSSLSESQRHLAWLETHAPDHPGTALASGVYLESRARYFEDDEPLEQAIAAYKKACERSPSDPQAWMELAAATYLLADVRHDGALLELGLQAIERAHALRPWHMETLRQLSVGLIRLGQASRSQETLERAIAILEGILTKHDDSSGPSEWRYHLGCAYDFLGEITLDVRHFEKAVEWLQAAYQSDSKKPGWRLNLAQSLIHYGEVSGQIEPMMLALEHLQAVSQVESEAPIVWLEWGQALLSLADMMHDPAQMDLHGLLLREAEEKLMRAAQLGEGVANFFLGCCYSLAQQPQLALDALLKAQQLRALPPLQELVQHDWLSALQGEPGFQQLLVELDDQA